MTAEQDRLRAILAKWKMTQVQFAHLIRTGHMSVWRWLTPATTDKAHRPIPEWLWQFVSAREALLTIKALAQEHNRRKALTADQVVDRLERILRKYESDTDDRLADR